MEVQTTVTKNYLNSLNLDPSVDFNYTILSSGRCDFNNGNSSWGDMPLEVMQQIRSFFEEMCYIKECIQNGKTPRFRKTQTQQNLSNENPHLNNTPVITEVTI